MGTNQIHPMQTLHNRSTLDWILEKIFHKHPTTNSLSKKNKMLDNYRTDFNRILKLK